VVRANFCKGPAYPGKGPKKSQRAKRKFWSQQVLFGTKFLNFGPKRANLATLMWCNRIMMKRVCTPVAAHRRWLSKSVIDTVSWLSQSTDTFTKFSEVNLQLQGNNVNLFKAKSAIFTFLSKFNTVQTKSSPSWTLTVSKSLTLTVSDC